MKDGTPVSRAIMVLLNDGTVAVDWGDGLFYDILASKFRSGSDKDVSHRLNSEELEQLKLNGVIVSYDNTQVYLVHMPERPLRTID
jgi:hypothetical protein